MTEFLNNAVSGFESGTAVALGNFDGFHRGHTAIVDAMNEFARQGNLVSCIYTFEVHPSSYLESDSEERCVPLLMTNAEKSKRAADMGVGAIVYDDFEAVCDMSPALFCEEVVIGRLNAKAVFCGQNFRFGQNAEGDADFLRAELSNYGVQVFTVPFVKHGGDIVSSTLIREFVEFGSVEIAEKLLGRPYSIECEVIHGMELGRKLGFPTINQLYPSEKVAPLRGVYASVCTVDGERYAAVSNVGVKPTVTDPQTAPLLCESYVIGYNGDAYGKIVKTEFCKMLRREKKFLNLDELTASVLNNIEETKAFFAKENRYGIILKKWENIE